MDPNTGCSRTEHLGVKIKLIKMRCVWGAAQASRGQGSALLGLRGSVLIECLRHSVRPRLGMNCPELIMIGICESTYLEV